MHNIYWNISFIEPFYTQPAEIPGTAAANSTVFGLNYNSDIATFLLHLLVNIAYIFISTKNQPFIYWLINWNEKAF